MGTMENEMSTPILIQPHLPLLEPSFTQEELQELSAALDEIERFEHRMADMFRAARRRSNAVQYGDTVQEEARSLPATDS